MAVGLAPSIGSILRDHRAKFDSQIQVSEPSKFAACVELIARRLLISCENIRNFYDYRGLLGKTEAEAGRDWEMIKRLIKEVTHRMPKGSEPTEEALRWTDGPHPREFFNKYQLEIPEWQPCLFKMTEYIFVNDNRCNVVFWGRFSCARDPGYEPYLTVGNRTFTLKKGEDEAILEFENLPKDIFPKLSTKTWDVVKATLTVPFDAGLWRQDRRMSVYNLWLRAAPLNPGIAIITLKWMETTSKKPPVSRNSNWVLLNEFSSVMSFHATEGHHINSRTIKFERQPVHPEGRVEAEIVEAKVTQVAVKIGVRPHESFSPVSVRVVFEEIPEENMQKSFTATQLLQWGNRVKLDTEKECSVKVEPSEGTYCDFHMPLRIYKTGKGEAVIGEYNPC